MAIANFPVTTSNIDNTEVAADWSQVLDDQSVSAIIAFGDMDDDMDETQSNTNATPIRLIWANRGLNGR